MKKSRMPRLSRGWRTARNLGMSLVMAVLIWGHFGYPLPTAEMEFRRLERTSLMGPSEIVFAAPKPLNDLEAADGTALCLIDPLVVGAGADWAAVGYPLRAQGPWDSLDVFPLEKGPSPLPLYSGPLTVDGRDDLTYSSPLLFLNIPEEGARGEFELDVHCREGDYHRECPLWDLGGGIWLTAAAPPEDTGYSTDWLEGGRYTLRLYRGDDSLLLEQKGTIPAR